MKLSGNARNILVLQFKLFLWLALRHRHWQQTTRVGITWSLFPLRPRTRNNWSRHRRLLLLTASLVVRPLSAQGNATATRLVQQHHWLMGRLETTMDKGNVSAALTQSSPWSSGNYEKKGTWGTSTGLTPGYRTCWGLSSTKLRLRCGCRLARIA